MGERVRAFLKRKDIEISAKRYGVDAMGAMAQGLFATLLIGTILNTLGTQFHIPFWQLRLQKLMERHIRQEIWQPP